MKKIGKNTKLYLIGMIIGGITLGITTVIADTIINSTSVAYKTTTVKAALDELYGLADLKPRVEELESYFVNDPTISFSGNAIGGLGNMPLKLDFLHEGTVRGRIAVKTDADNGVPYFAIAGKAGTDVSTDGRLDLWGVPLKINNTNFEDMFITEKLTFDKVTLASNGDTWLEKSVHKGGYTSLITNCYAASGDNGDARYIMTYASRFKTETDHESVHLFYVNIGKNVGNFYPTCEVLYVKNTAE